MRIIQIKTLVSLAAIAVMVSCHIARAQERSSKPAPNKPASTTINDFAWIAGDWQGEAMGGKFEESWNAPSGGAMMGMFKMVSDGKVNFYEILTIVPKDGSFVLRLKHFGADLVGWEDKDKSVEFPLVSVTEKEAQFNGLTFRKIDQNQMHILVTMKTDKGSSVVNFKCRRTTEQPSNKTVAIQKVLQFDELIAKQRDQTPKTHGLAVAVETYVLGLDQIDYSECPADFSSAYQAHRDAWHDSIEFMKKHESLRGEMHQLFDQLKKTDPAIAKEFDQHNQSILKTWNEIERIAKKHGVK